MRTTSVNANANPEKRHPLKEISWLLIASCALINLTGCATAPNGFSQFYQDRAGAAVTNLLSYSGSTKIFTTSNATNDIKAARF